MIALTWVELFPHIIIKPLFHRPSGMIYSYFCSLSALLFVLILLFPAAYFNWEPFPNMFWGKSLWPCDFTCDHVKFPCDFPGGSEGKASACDAGDSGFIPGSGRSSVEGNGNPLQYSCLENPMDRRLWYSPWDHRDLDMAEQLYSLSFTFMFL